ncbi:hypothetical protein nbrc107696_13760 [Gordonia spumicola]|uniref:MspA protein n=1 Tax=Gordonia spumicola TaxID=589161 RepID=A0A7I9V781_9ACTN|nr:hypothetical protein nbrc107696_13760 [Gordonia spumicola]
MKRSDDGWTVRLTKSAEKIVSVPPLSRGVGSFEAFLDLRGEAEITGHGAVPVDAAVLTSGYQLSCQWQMSSVNVGISGGPTAQASITWPPAVVFGVQAMPTVSTTLANGATVDVKFGQKALTGARAGTRAEGVRVEISGCVGARPAVRAYIRVSMATAANDNTFTIYGSPHLL